MRAAIYLRLSTEDPKGSLAAQESGARDWCERNGHSVVAVHRDEGVSGSEWKARPGIVALRASVSEKPRPFDVVVVRDLDRLGRDAIRLPELLAYLRDEGVSVVEWSTGQTVQLDGMALIIAQLRAGMAQIERENTAHRIRTALARKAERGLVVGGEVYGYARDRRADGVHYVVDADEAAVVREVFERRAKGEGLRAIVASLNARGVPGPRGGAWAVSALHEMVGRDRYLGVVRWGVRGSTYKHGTRVATEGAAVEVRDESLRIVGDDLWRAAQARTDEARRAIGRATARGRGRYLLAGYAMCGHCGGPITSARTKVSREIVPAYACGWYRDRGAAVCSMAWRRPVERVDRVVLGWLLGEVLTPRVIAGALDAARAAAATLAQPDTRDALRAEERGLAAAVSRLTAALEHAGDVPEIADRLRVQSERLREVRAELARAEAPRPTVAPADIDAAVADLRRDLEGDTAAARDVLGLLLLGRVRLTGGGRGRPVEIEAEAHVGRLVTSDAGGTSGALTGCGHTPCPGVVVLRAAA